MRQAQGTEAAGRGADLLRSPVRREIMDLLAGLPCEGEEQHTRARGLTAAQVGDATRLHVTTARFHLDQLLDAGLVTASFDREGVGRPRKRYAVAASDWALDVAPGRGYALLARLLARAVASSPQEEPLSPEDAGRAWAAEHVTHPTDGPGAARTEAGWRSRVETTTELLRQWGYVPQVTHGPEPRTAQVDLHGCPVIDLARDETEVVCSVHRGLLAGALEALGEADVQVELEPFVTPTRCRARLSAAGRLPEPSSDVTSEGEQA